MCRIAEMNFVAMHTGPVCTQTPSDITCNAVSDDLCDKQPDNRADSHGGARGPFIAPGRDRHETQACPAYQQGHRQGSGNNRAPDDCAPRHSGMRRFRNGLRTQTCIRTKLRRSHDDSLFKIVIANTLVPKQGQQNNDRNRDTQEP
ncbi:hypothetical protein H671_21588 [Cricetulus griseus]|uniref:Uncharacterized protein n=1 Tax=Cricetulus griseus TaxID=10029 RepID=A0A061HUR1_CRIGR|nr:hypothetical protein H671_21588 [Cricetulus griseus]